MKKIYKTLLVSVFSSTLVINAWGDVFDVTEETGDGNIGKLVEELKKDLQKDGDYTKQFGEVIEKHQEEFCNIVSKYIASKIDKDNLNELLKQAIKDKIKVDIKTLNAANEEAVRYCFQMPGIAVWVPKGDGDDKKIKIYIAMKRCALKNGEKVADNSKNLLSFSENMHTERQLVLAALTDNGQRVNGGDVSEKLKEANSWHKKGGKLYIYLPATPCHDLEGIPTQSSNSNTTNNMVIAGENSNNNKNTNEKGGMHCVDYFSKLKQQEATNDTCKLIVFFPFDNIRVRQTDKGIMDENCLQLLGNLLSNVEADKNDNGFKKVKYNVNQAVRETFVKALNSCIEMWGKKLENKKDVNWINNCEEVWKEIVDDSAAEYVALPPIKK